MELKPYDYIVGILSTLMIIVTPTSIKYTLQNIKVHVTRRTN